MTDGHFFTKLNEQLKSRYLRLALFRKGLRYNAKVCVTTQRSAFYRKCLHYNAKGLRCNANIGRNFFLNVLR